MNDRSAGSGPPPRPANAQGAQAANRQQGASTSLLEMSVAKLTDVGSVRDHNEDYASFYIPPDPQQRAAKGAIYLVADGMGGHQAGEVASQGAVELVIGEYYADTTHDIGTSLVRAFRAANDQIYNQAQANAARSGMGTTLVAAVILGRKVYLANVGDSRAYLINQKGIQQITEDHSWVAEQVAAGLITPEQARSHPQRNVITRALGTKPTVEVDLFEGEIGEGDTLLLCSDGLTGHLEDRDLAAIVRGGPPDEAAERLVAEANKRGGQDNISVVLVSARKASAAPAAAAGPVAAGPVAAAGGGAEAAAAPAAAPPAEATRRRRLPMVPILAVLAMALVGVAALLFVLNRGDGEATPVAMVQATATVEATASGAPAETQTALPAATVAITEAGTVAAGEPLTTTGGTVPTDTPVAEVAPGQPTVTLAPTETPAPLPPTPRPTRTTQPASPTQSPPSQPTPYPAPVLRSPEAGAAMNGEVRFEWQWNHGPLGSQEYFDLRIWSQAEETAGSEPQGVILPTKQTFGEIRLEDVTTIQEHQTGGYYWGVVVVHKPCPGPESDCPARIVGQWSEERPFSYSAPSGESSGGAGGPGGSGPGSGGEGGSGGSGPGEEPDPNPAVPPSRAPARL